MRNHYMLTNTVTYTTIIFLNPKRKIRLAEEDLTEVEHVGQTYPAGAV